MSESLLDTDRLVAGVRWRRRLWMTMAVLGLLAGAVFTFALPRPPTAVARVLVVGEDDDSADRMTLMETDIALFETTQVAAAVLQRIGSAEPPAGFLATYQGEGLTPNVLQIAVQGSSADDAVRRAQALADVFIANHISRAEGTAGRQADALLNRRAEVERSVEDTGNEIATASVQGAAVAPQSREALNLAAKLDALYTRRAGFASQIADLGKRAEDLRLSAGRVAIGTQLVDPPRAVVPSRVTTGIQNMAAGLVLGLGAGLALAAVLSITRNRPILRRDIAADLGVPVIVQLPAARGRWRWRGNRARRRAATTLARLVHDAPRPASLLEIGCPRTAAALAGDIAVRIGAERPVVVIDDLRHRALRRATRPHPSVEIVDPADLPLDRPHADPRPELYLGLGSLRPGRPWVDLDRLGTRTLLVVHAGHATASWLHTVARQLGYAGITPVGVALVAPHPSDRSDGALWNALHTAVDGERAAPDRARTNGVVRHELV